MQTGSAKVVLLALAITSLAACATHKEPPVRDITMVTKPIPSREEILLCKIRESASEMATLIVKYEQLIVQLQGLEDARSAQRILEDLAAFLLQEGFHYAAHHVSIEAVRRIGATFSPQSLVVLRSTGMYDSVITIAVMIANLTTKLQQLAELNEQAAVLKQQHAALVREAFPRIAKVQAILRGQEGDVEAAQLTMRQLRSLLSQIESTVRSWETRKNFMEREVSQ